jgi:hypothetical protein
MIARQKEVLTEAEWGSWLLSPRLQLVHSARRKPLKHVDLRTSLWHWVFQMHIGGKLRERALTMLTGKGVRLRLRSGSSDRDTLTKVLSEFEMVVCIGKGSRFIVRLELCTAWWCEGKSVRCSVGSGKELARRFRGIGRSICERTQLRIDIHRWATKAYRSH